MKKSIEKFCRSCDNGLFLLDMPTGYGKTYSVLDFIADFYDNPIFADTKIFFITTLKKNLPEENLREHFKKRGKEQEFDKICLRLKANYEGVIDKLTLVANKIPLSIKAKDEYRSLFNSVQIIEKYKKKTDSGKYDEIMATLYKNAEVTVRDQQERLFRENVIMPYLKKFKTPLEKLKAIQNEPEYQWIGELYPAVFTREKRIFFMSMDKFILGNTTIIEPTYSFYNNQIIDNSFIFIDEFDATRDNMLKQVIKKGLENHLDYLTLFNQIHASLATRQFPLSLTTDSKKQQEYLDEHPHSKTSQEIIDGFSKVIQETYVKYSMQYSFKTDEDTNIENGRNFIFNDLQFHSVLAGDNSFVQIKTDEKAKQNWLQFIKKRPTEQDSGILGLLSSVKGGITYYQYGCRLLANNYKKLKEEHKKTLDDDFTLENAITSVLREFHLSKEYQRYLTQIILSGQAQTKRDKKDGEGKLSLRYFDRSIYDRGFRYYDFIDDPNHDMQSEIMLFDFQDSPEKILIKMAERAKVIGISATATLDTVIGNYDLDYLRRILQKKYYLNDVENQKRLVEGFGNAIQNYNKVNIHVTAVSCDRKNIEVELQQVFTNKALIKKYTEKLETTFSGSIQYAVDIFVKIIKVMKDFILNNEVKSFLCLTNKLAQENKSVYDLKLLQEFANEIIKENKIGYLNGYSLVYSLAGDEYDFKYNDMIRRLSRGEKLFVVSSYSTVGAGQNLQYPTPNNVEVVTVNDYARGEKEKDFDCLFLEKPTHLLVNVDSKKNLELEDMIRYIYQMEFLMERGEVSRTDGIASIKSAFLCYSGSNKWIKNNGKLYETDSVNNAAIRVLIQAVGRICRTGLKNKDIFIYVDEEIFKKYDLSKVEDRMLNPEFRKIIEFGKQYKIVDPNNSNERAILENAAGNLSIKTMQIINDLMKFRTEDDCEYWKNLRELSLMRPTLNKNEVEGGNGNIQYQLLYMKAPCEMNYYSYEQEGDYNSSISIKFDDSLSLKMSEDEVRLQEVLSIPGLKKYFEEKHYATSFLKNEYLLTPPMFNNIYKGALGETVGKYIFERYLNVELLEMPYEFFEKFDFTVGDGIYIDFKYWKESNKVDALSEKEKVLSKLIECNGKRAIIVNILNYGENIITTSANGKIIEISGLYRLDKHCLDEVILNKIYMEGYLR